MSTRAQMLKETPLFGGIRDDIIDFVLDQVETLRLRKDEFLFREGDASTTMYVIEVGAVAILKQHSDRQILLRTLGVGDCIGEMALFDFMPRSASAQIVEDAQLIEISSMTLMSVYERDLEQFALIEMNMGREVTRRLRLTEERSFHQWAEHEIGH